MACAGHTCWLKIARVKKWETDLVVRSIKRTKLKWFVPRPAPGESEQVVKPERMDGELRARMREGYGAPEGFVVEDHDDCPEGGCHCEYGEGEGELIEEDKMLLFDETEFVYVIRDFVTSPDWNADPPQVRDSNGTPTTLNPLVHHLELRSRQPGVTYWRETRYAAKVVFDLKADYYEKAGECKPGSGENQYFVEARPRRAPARVALRTV